MNDEHLRRMHEALKSEERFARAEHERTMALPVEKRAERGATWAGVQLEVEPGFGKNRWVVRVRGSLHNGIGAGNTVRVGGLVGRCVGWEPHVAEIIVAGDAAALEGVTSVDLAFDGTGYVGLRQNLERCDELTSPVKDALLEGAEIPEPAGRVWDGLNEGQAAAADLAHAASSLAVIHGPPGTGKTHTLVALLKAAKGTRWALAESNAAVDHLATSAARAGLDVVRVGPTYRMVGPVREFSVDERVRNGPHAAAIRALDKEISRARKAGGPTLWKLLHERRDLLETAENYVLDGADVIATTLGTLARRAQRLPRASVAVIDEVTQAVEPMVWAAVPWIDKLIVAGDPHQLGPVVFEPGNPLECGLLERLQGQVAMPMLEVQHRMSMPIQRLVRDVYGERYRPHPDVEHAAIDGIPSVCFVDTAGAGEEERDPVTRSVRNPLEVRLVTQAVVNFAELGIPTEAMAVIAPYSAQVEALQRALPDVEVATVNAFQGREADVVLISFTRSNLEREVGFVADRRRLTVALTRPRRALWMVGDSSTLGGHSAFDGLLEDAEISSVWEEPWIVAMSG